MPQTKRLLKLHTFIRNMKKLIIITLIIILLTSLAQATTLKGSIYNENLEVENDVLVTINTEPVQKYLAKEGSYSFNLPPGTYILIATKGFISTSEEINIITEGEFIYDIFLLDDFTEEEQLWSESEEKLFIEDETEEDNRTWAYWLAGIIFLLTIIRLVRARKKYGPLRLFRKKIKAEQKKTVEEHKQELAEEPDYLDKTLDIIKKNNGRISQKQLRKELLYLSEAKVSLILTELEHKGMVEKVKKGRGNVIILKS
jgi:uncharacterized membrane protein